MYDEWNDYAFPYIREIAKTDKFYRELLESTEEKWKESEPIRKKLTPEEWRILEDYISCCENMEYRFAQLAYEFGKHPR